MSIQLNQQIHNKILNSVYCEKIYLLNKINSMGILPYLPDELITYILQFFVTITDYLDYYIEKMYRKNI